MQSTTLALATQTDSEFHIVSIIEVPHGESASQLEISPVHIVVLNVSLPRVAAARVWNALRARMQTMAVSENSNPETSNDFSESTCGMAFPICCRTMTLYTDEECVSPTSSEEEFGVYSRRRKASVGVEIGSAAAELSARRAARIHEEMLRLIASDSELRDADASLAAALRRRCRLSVSEGSN